VKNKKYVCFPWLTIRSSSKFYETISDSALNMWPMRISNDLNLRAMVDAGASL
jgi:hypothetical protein